MENIKDYEAMAKLDLPEEERRAVEALADKLADSFGALADIDTGGAEPLYTVLEVGNVLREDVSVKLLTRDELLANAPQQQDGYFQVPKTI